MKFWNRAEPAVKDAAFADRDICLFRAVAERCFEFSPDKRLIIMKNENTIFIWNNF